MISDGTVYLIDDDLSVRRAVERLIRSYGYRVITCASAVEFLALRDIPRPVCLVVDVRMPGQTGFDLQEALLAAGRDEPVVFITGHGDQAMAARALSAGALDVLLKPVDERLLMTAIERGLRADARRFGLDDYSPDA